MSQHSPLGMIIRQVRDVLRETHYIMMSDARLLIEQAYTLLTLENPATASTALYASDLAFTVAMMMESTLDQGFVRLGLGMLLKLGVIGELLAVAILQRRKVSYEVALAIVAAFPAREKLCLANRILRDPNPNDPRFLRWAYETAKTLQGDNPDATLLFLEAMPPEEDYLSYPLQRALLSSRFGVWLHRLLALDLAPEQLTFMARTAGRMHSHQAARSLARRLKSTETKHLPLLIDAIGRSAAKKSQKITRALVPLLKHKSPAVALAALEALKRIHADQYSAALGYLYGVAPENRDLLCLMLLDSSATEFNAALIKIPATEQRDLLLFLLACVAGHYHDWVVATLGLLRRRKRNGQDWELPCRLLTDYLAAFKQPRPVPGYKPALAKKTKIVSGSESLAAAAAGMLDRIKRKLGADVDQDDGSRKKEVETLQILSRGDVAEKAAFQRLSLVGVRLADVAYLRATFFIVDFRAASLQNLRFEKCMFKHIDFDAATLENVIFASCELINCRFADTTLRGVVFENCSLYGVQFNEATAVDMVCTDCVGQDLDFSGAQLQNWRVERCHFSTAHFAYTAAQDLRWDGVECVQCRFDNLYLYQAAILNTTATACSFSRCRCYGLDSDEPGFLLQEFQTALGGFATQAASIRRPEPPPQLGSADGIALMVQVLDRWFFERDAKRHLQLFLASNASRKEWAACMLGNPTADFLKILPSLIETGVNLEMPEGKASLPACRIHGYSPDHTTCALLEKYGLAPATEQGALKAKPLPIPVEGLYTIGSTGTIAQVRASDIDLWLCYDGALVPAATAAQIRSKLEVLEHWAGATFGLEVHFFLMELDQMRENNFGFTDKESSGSSQARLLKEEFYRTAVYLAGKKPAWWYFRSELGHDEYLRELDKLYAATTLPDAKRFIDCGNLVEIPQEEFFGASLWQIVKAMKSPFKSVMKLALLDKYLHGQDSSVLLCNRIKENIFLGRRDLWDIDPYAVMFRDIFEYYGQTGQHDARNLMRLAFMHKTGLLLSAHSSGRFYELQAYSFLEYFFPYSEADIASHIEPNRAEPVDPARTKGDFAELVGLGNQMLHFMFKTYATIQAMLGEHNVHTMVTREDLTKIGRKVFSHLRPRKNKIMRLPFMDASQDIFAGLEFTAEGAVGTPLTWIVCGEPHKRKGRKYAKEEIWRGKCLDELLVWLVANEVYSPTIPLKAGQLDKTVSLPDIAGLLAMLYDTFPAGPTFDNDINLNLQPEQAVKTLIIVNLAVPREERAFQRVTLVYGTNWGELFCLLQPKRLDLLRESGYAFVKANVERLSPDITIKTFTPAKALCPQIFV